MTGREYYVRVSRDYARGEFGFGVVGKGHGHGVGSFFCLPLAPSSCRRPLGASMHPLASCVRGRHRRGREMERGGRGCASGAADGGGGRRREVGTTAGLMSRPAGRSAHGWRLPECVGGRSRIASSYRSPACCVPEGGSPGGGRRRSAPLRHFVRQPSWLLLLL